MTKPDATDVDVVPSKPGHDALWAWFGLSRSSWLTLPRVMMHEMPDAWQADMARLLGEWDNTWRGEGASTIATTRVLKSGQHGRFEAWPEWVLNYRRPNGDALAGARGAQPLMKLDVGDPRRAAWLQHWRNTDMAEVAQAVERFRQPIDVEADWPPESSDVTCIDYGSGRVSWFIPPHTPEWASHVAHLRRQGRTGSAAAQSLDINPRQMTARSRWAAAATEGTDKA